MTTSVVKNPGHPEMWDGFVGNIAYQNGILVESAHPATSIWAKAEREPAEDPKP